MKRNASYEVARHEGNVFLKLSGHLTYSECGPLAEFIQHLAKEVDYSGVFVDLRSAELIDSTTIGLIAKLALVVSHGLSSKMTILSTVPAVSQSLVTTGLEHLAVVLNTLTDGPTDGPYPEPESVESLPPSEQDIARVMLDAHKILMELNDRNKVAFSRVVDMLEASVADKED